MLVFLFLFGDNYNLFSAMTPSSPSKTMQGTSLSISEYVFLSDIVNDMLNYCWFECEHILQNRHGDSVGLTYVYRKPMLVSHMYIAKEPQMIINPNLCCSCHWYHAIASRTFYSIFLLKRLASFSFEYVCLICLQNVFFFTPVIALDFYLNASE